MRSAASPSPGPPDGLEQLPELEHAATDATHLLAFHAPSHRASMAARRVSKDSRGFSKGSSFEDCVNTPLSAAAANPRQQHGHQQHQLHDQHQLQQPQHQQQQEASPAEPPCPDLQAAEKAVSARLLPPLLLLVMVSYIDRTNLSFASIQLSHDLQLSSTMYGLGSGAFFLAYAFGQIPSNFLLLRYGGPTWLAAITLAWGAVASAFALVRGPVSFVLLRLALGLAESGAMPGIWYYISLFYPAHKTTVPYSLIETGITVSQVIAAPFAAGLLMLDGVAGLRGWQWLFLLEGLPALALGCFIRVWLPASVATASFLPANQKSALSKALAAAAAEATAASPPAPAVSASGGGSAGAVSPASDGAVVAVAGVTGDALAGEQDDIQVCIHDTLTSSPRSRTSSGSSDQTTTTAAASSSGSSNSSSKGSQQRWRHDQQQQQLEGRDLELQADLDLHTMRLAAATAPAGAVPPNAASGCAVLHSSIEAGRGTEQQSLLDANHINSSAYVAAAAPAAEPAGCSSSQCSNVRSSSLSSFSSSSSNRWQSLLAVAKNRVVLYAGCWRVLHDIPGSGTLYYTPMIVQALLLAAGSGGAVAGAARGGSDNFAATYNSSSSSDMSMGGVLGNSSTSSSSSGGGGGLHSSSAAVGPGVYVVLLSSIPYAAASLFHLVNAWHSQKHSERRWHIALTWLAGAAALVLLPLAAAGGLAAVSSGASQPAGPAAGPLVTPAAAVAAFVLLVVVHVGVNGANGLQTGLVAGSIVPGEKALGLALYNTIGCIGAFWGPLVIGVLHDATGGFSVALLLLGVSLAAGAVMVVRFRPEKLDPRLTGARRV